MDKHMIKYSTYGVADFLSDDLFIRWAQYPTEENSLLWTAVVQQYPEKQALINTARELAIALGSQHAVNAAHLQEALWQQIAVAVAPVRDIKRTAWMVWWKRVAVMAAAACILVYAGYQWYLGTDKIEKTGYGNKLVIQLPDASELMLNRNSSVSYPRRWGANRSREVTMTGEVDFTVRHVASVDRLTTADSFRVHVNGLRVTVLGTAFNIHSRRGKTAISLREGRLRIDFIKQSLPAIILQPGEQYVYDTARTQVAIQKVNAGAAAAWKRNTLSLEGTSVAEIVALLEDEYGYTVQVKDTTLLKRKLSGNVPMNNVGNLFFVLKNILDVTVEQEGNTLIITNR
jgi:transmembrane sensor